MFIVIIVVIISFYLNIGRDVVYFVYYYSYARCRGGDVSKSPGDCNFFVLFLVQ